MKYILTILLILQTTNTYPQMNNTFETDGFIIFSNEYTEFSDSFRKEMARQLEEQFIELMGGDKDILDKYYFGMMVGSGYNGFEMRVNDGIVSAQVEVLSPDSQARWVTVSWYSDDISDKESIHRSDITGKNVNFYFGDDFPREALLRYTRPYKEIKKGEDGLNFDMNVYVLSFPDVFIVFDLIEPLTKEERYAVWKIFDTYNKGKDTLFYLSDFTDNYIHLDYYIRDTDYSTEDLKVHINELINLFAEISSFSYSKKIKSVEIK